MHRALAAAVALSAAVVPAQVVAAAPPSPAHEAAAGVRHVVARLDGWARHTDGRIVGDRRCLLFRHEGQLAHRTLFFEARAPALSGLSVVASVSVYASRSAARRALAESASASWQACSRASYARAVRRQGLVAVSRSGVASWAQAPAGSQAVAQHLVARLEGGQTALLNSIYELEDTHDARVVYGFSIAGERAIPRALVRSLLALAG